MLGLMTTKRHYREIDWWLHRTDELTERVNMQSVTVDKLNEELNKAAFDRAALENMADNLRRKNDTLRAALNESERVRKQAVAERDRLRWEKEKADE